MKTADRQTIFEICNELDEKGQKPTLDRVRQMLGGGSFSTIQPILKEWKERRAAEPATEPLVAPEDIRGLVESLAAQVWNKAKVKASADLQTLKTAMQARFDDVEQERNEGAAEIERLEKEAGQQKEKAATVENELAEYKNALQQARVELAVQSKQLVEAEGLQKRHEKLLLEFGELKGRLASAAEKKQ